MIKSSYIYSYKPSAYNKHLTGFGPLNGPLTGSGLQSPATFGMAHRAGLYDPSRFYVAHPWTHLLGCFYHRTLWPTPISTITLGGPDRYHVTNPCSAWGEGRAPGRASRMTRPFNGTTQAFQQTLMKKYDKSRSFGIKSRSFAGLQK